MNVNGKLSLSEVASPTTDRKSMKRFANGVLERINKDHPSVTFQQILEGVSSGYGAKDWNTLSSWLEQTEVTPDKVLVEEVCLPKDDVNPSVKASRPGCTLQVMDRAESAKWMADELRPLNARTSIVILADGTREWEKQECYGTHWHLVRGIKSKYPSGIVVMNRKENSLNPFELPFQSLSNATYRASPAQRNALANMIACICSGYKSIYSEIPGIEAALVDILYESHMPGSSKEKKYEKMISYELDNSRWNKVAQKRTWWDFARLMDSSEQTELASIAQSKAVPTLVDFYKLLCDTESTWNQIRTKLPFLNQKDSFPRFDIVLDSMAKDVSIAIDGCPTIAERSNLILSIGRPVILDCTMPSRREGLSPMGKILTSAALACAAGLAYPNYSARDTLRTSTPTQEETSPRFGLFVDAADLLVSTPMRDTLQHFWTEAKKHNVSMFLAGRECSSFPSMFAQ